VLFLGVYEIVDNADVVVDLSVRVNVSVRVCWYYY